MSKRSRDIQSQTFERLMRFEAPLQDGDVTIVPAALSSEEPVERWFGKEILSHDREAVDLSRAADGLPLLWNHDSNQPIGKVRNVRIDGDGKLRGELVFHDITERARDAALLVRNGWINGVSIGYRIKQWVEEKGSDVVRATKWALYESSIAPVPADGSVGAYRSGDTEMSEIHDGSPVQPDGQSAVVDVDKLKREYKVARLDGAREATVKERARLKELDDLFGMAIIPDNDFYRALRMQAVDDGWSVEDARKLVLDALSGEAVPAFDHRTAVDKKPAMPVRASQPQTPSQQFARVESGIDDSEKFRQIATEAILVRGGLETDKDMVRRVNESGYRRFSLQKLGEEFLALRNVSTRGLDNDKICQMLVTRAGPHTHSDFTSILANVATKAAMKGWMEAGTTWQEWCNTGSLPDFKQATIAGLGAFPDLDQIPYGGGPYKHKSMEDVYETAQIATYGALFGVSRRAIQDDDLMQLTRAPQKMGQAAARKVNSLAYAVILGTGQTMTEDSTALFDAAAHANYIGSGGSGNGAPSTTTLDAAFAAMSKQKAPLRSGDTSTPYINIVPAYLLVPPELRGTAETIAQAQYDPNAGTTTKNQFNPNRYQGRLMVVSEPILSAVTTQWVLAAPKAGPVDTVTVFFLDGRQEPYLEEATQIEYDGVTWKVRIDAVARALDYRGLYKNYGA